MLQEATTGEMENPLVVEGLALEGDRDWVKQRDDLSARDYYVHKRSGETRWTDPAAAPAAEHPWVEALIGLGRIVALYHRSSNSYQVH